MSTPSLEGATVMSVLDVEIDHRVGSICDPVSGSDQTGAASAGMEHTATLPRITTVENHEARLLRTR
jgi:hypothetical protein